MRDHHKVFADRLARIAAQAGNTNGAVHIGMEGAVPVAVAMQVRQGLAGKVLAAAVDGLSPWSVPAALFSGALALFAAHLARVWTFGPGLGQAGLLIDLTGALFAIVVLRGVLRLRGPGALALQLTGAAIVAGGLHNVVHQWPHLLAAVFPPSWTEAMLASTQPMTVSLGALGI
jgi:hypothetical protein